MQKIVIEIPEDLSQEYTGYQDRFREIFMLGLHQIKVQESLMLYARGIVSMGRAAELADLSLLEMIRQARAFGIQPRWSEKMAQEELQ